jgi:hypothetical protein
MLHKFFNSHTFHSQVLQRYLGFIILKIIIKFLHYGLTIFAGFVHNVVTLLRSIYWILKKRGSVRRRLWRMNMWRRMMLKSLFSWLILKGRGSVRRLQRIIMCKENNVVENSPVMSCAIATMISVATDAVTHSSSLLL